MDITEVTVSLADEDKLRGFANIVLDGHFVVRGLKIIEHIGRFFIAMPSRRQKDGSFRDIAHPISPEFRARLEQTVMDKYWEERQRTSVQGSS